MGENADAPYGVRWRDRIADAVRTLPADTLSILVPYTVDEVRAAERYGTRLRNLYQPVSQAGCERCDHLSHLWHKPKRCNEHLTIEDVSGAVDFEATGLDGLAMALSQAHASPPAPAPSYSGADAWMA